MTCTGRPKQKRGYPGIGEKVGQATYRGELAPARVREVIADSCAVLLPTKAPEEGYPGVLIEAWQVGRPAICTAPGPMGEIVRDGVNAVLLRTGRREEIADAMAEVTEQPERWLQLCESCARWGERFRGTPQLERMESWAEQGR